MLLTTDQPLFASYQINKLFACILDNAEQRALLTEQDKASPTSILLKDFGRTLNLGSSFVQRTRYLSRSPKDGPSAFMVRISLQTRVTEKREPEFDTRKILLFTIVLCSFLMSCRIP